MDQLHFLSILKLRAAWRTEVETEGRKTLPEVTLLRYFPCGW